MNSINSFSTPDFAFPKTVATNARSELKNALKKSDGPLALQALIQTVIADNLVSTDNAGRGAMLIDSVSALLPAPYSSLGYLLEATLYRDIYQNDRYRFDQRTLPADKVPEEVAEWNRDVFSRKVRELVRKAFQGSDSAKELGFSKLAGVITNASAADSLGLSLYDFMTIQGVSVLKPLQKSTLTIPFFTGANDSIGAQGADVYSMVDSLLDANAAWHQKEGLTSGGAVMGMYRVSLQSGEEASETLSSLAEKYLSTPYCASFLLELIQRSSPSQEDYRKQYEQAQTYLTKFPDARDAEALKYALEKMCIVSLDCSNAAQVLPGEEFKVNLTVRNLPAVYLLAVKLPGDKIPDRLNMRDIKKGKIIASKKIEIPEGDTVKPFYSNADYSFPALTSGVYTFAFSSTPDFSGIINIDNTNIATFLVSRLSSFQSYGVRNQGGEENYYYVVEGKNQQPVADAEVSFTPAWNNRKWKSLSVFTDKDGKVAVPEGSYNVTVKAGEDRLFDNVYQRGLSNLEKEHISGKLFSDLSIYHPGDSVGFTGVVYTQNGRTLDISPEKNIKVILRDANFQSIDTLNLCSDRFGRVIGSIKLPSDGLRGNWSLMMHDGKNYFGQTYFEVADYKSPSFYVAVDGTEGELSIGESIRIKGMVKTYSGMAVSGAEVKYNVRFDPWIWRRNADWTDATYGGSTKTAADGSFIIELPTQSLKGTPFAKGCYTLDISATDGAGETVEADPTRFFMGTYYSIVPDIPEKIEADKSKPVYGSVAVYDVLNYPVVKDIYYRILSLPDSVKVTEGKFKSGHLPFDLSSLKSGGYRIIMSLDDSFKAKDDDSNAEGEFVVWRESDKTPPVTTALWVPTTEILLSPSDIEQGKMEVKVGSAWPDSYIYANISNLKGDSESRWLKVSDGIVKLPVKAPAPDDRVKVIFAGMRDLQSIQQNVTLIPEIQTKGLEIETITFRDRLTPGAKEEWRFKFMFDGKALPSLPVMGVMSNKALDALAPFEWAFNPYSSIRWNVPTYVNIGSLGRSFWYYLSPMGGSPAFEGTVYPAWNTYGRSLYAKGDAFAGAIRVRGTQMMKSKAYQEASMSSDAKQEGEEVMEFKAMASVKNDAAEATLGESEVERAYTTLDKDASEEADFTRDVECPLAFFMPDLLTDKEGIAALDFEVPMFNGTWQLQLMGYTPQLRGAVIKLDAVASKPVMVKLNSPRFARTGDLLFVSANIYNNTPDEAELKGKIEFYNPLNGDVIAFLETSPESVAPMGSDVITSSLRIPSDMDLLGIRVTGYGEKSRDGEQIVIPLFPSSTPVTESKTFYLAPGEESYTMQLPEEKNNGAITLSYTDNPIWECLTALPALSEADSQNALTQVAALYGNAMASGLLKKYPELEEALRLFADPANSADSTLVSNLQKNATLKIVALRNTPWVRNAQSQTLRMSRLAEYAEPGKAQQAIEDNLSKLSNLQNSDGGWSWCENMRPDYWISKQVLSHLAMLKRNGYLPDEAKKMAEKGFAYVDREIVSQWKEAKRDKFSYISLLDYLYARSNYGKISASSDFAKIKARALQEISNGWKKMSIYNKATAAIVLYREGNKTLAQTILSSLEEYSSSTKEKGVWFDNLSSGFNGQSKLLTTAQVLEAWSIISPSSPMVDGLRQWLLLSKQVQDWGNGAATADLVQAIFDAGSQWTLPTKEPEIYIDGERLQLDRVSHLTGSVFVPLTGKSGTLTIRRSASGPAWGGIVTQYVEPIADVKAAKVPQLSVEKALFVITADSAGNVASDGVLRQGDRVRVTLTLKCDRDLQFVTVADCRSAALQPAEQTSGYTSSDGVWMYREVRNSSTNLFIPFLSKGAHIVSYDCFIDREGEYSLGIAEAQSQYAPVITAHSAGKLIVIEE